jgi:hypothetical protein
MYRARILGLPVGAVAPLNGPGQGAAGDITCDLRHSRGYSQIASTSGPDTEQFDDPTRWQQYFEQFIRPRLRDLSAKRASGGELIERLHAIAADYKLFLFNDNSRS